MYSSPRKRSRWVVLATLLTTSTTLWCRLPLLSGIVISGDLYRSQVHQLKDTNFNADDSDLSWRLFNATALSSASTSYHHRISVAELFLSTECADRWIARGELCDDARNSTHLDGLGESMKLSILHTWTNGSDNVLARWRTGYYGLLAASFGSGNADRHFR